MFSFRKITAVVSAFTIMLSAAAMAYPRIPTSGVNAAQTLSLSKYSMSLGCGEDFSISANQDVTWRSSDSGILTVDSSGTVCGVSCGKAYVTARSSEGEEKSCCITVKPEPETVTMTSKRLIMGVGEKASLSSVIPEGTAAAGRLFYSTDKNIIRMTKTEWSAEFQAVSPGAARVVVLLYNGQRASCTITVKPAPENVRITKGILTLGVGEKYSFGSAINSGSAAKKRTYRTSNSSVVKMTRTDWQGDIVAVKPGVAYVTVRTYNGKEDACKVTVKKAPSKVYLTRTVLTLKEGESYKLGSYTDAGSEALRRSYRTSNSSVLKITSASDGSFTALKPGKAYITVRTYNGKECSCRVTVEPKQKKEVIGGVTYINGVLIVNKTYSIPRSYGSGLDRTTYSAYCQMADAASSEGISIYIASGFRSYDTQDRLYNYYCGAYGKTAADRFSARPGHSEHQTGLAMDINDPSDSFIGTAAQKWLEKNCYKYGFIIRYPKGKEDITGYKYESWHVRYVGKALAKELTEKNLTLEEYFNINSKYVE